ncbi:MAG: hypothetical protein EBR54_09635 [Flavobacteriia bacterium]|nr:hypothetical protein [Flavobacteriia bacterium]
MFKSRTLAVKLKLEMKISDVEYQADMSRATLNGTEVKNGKRRGLPCENRRVQTHDVVCLSR